MVSNKTFFLSERLYFLTFKTIREKFSQYLLKLQANSQSREVTLPKSIHELSEYFAVSRPALSRIIRELVREGIIEQNRRRITIKDPSRLKILDKE
jgi:CRP-like cAMP-binding protein